MSIIYLTFTIHTARHKEKRIGLMYLPVVASGRNIKCERIDEDGGSGEMLLILFRERKKIEKWDRKLRKDPADSSGRKQNRFRSLIVFESKTKLVDVVSKDTLSSRMSSDQRSDAVPVMKEAAIKLAIKSQTLASAFEYFHRFYSSLRNVCDKTENADDGQEPSINSASINNRTDASRYDPLLLATCIFLASKVEEDQVELRDIINVFHRSLHPDQSLQDLGPVYWSLRDSISHLEMILLRFLHFQVIIDHHPPPPPSSPPSQLDLSS